MKGSACSANTWCGRATLPFFVLVLPFHQRLTPLRAVLQVEFVDTPMFALQSMYDAWSTVRGPGLQFGTQLL